jgi:CRP-like cAMP-binding protein
MATFNRTIEYGTQAPAHNQSRAVNGGRSDPDVFATLIRTLELRDELSAEERRLVRELPARIRTFAAGHALVAEGSRPTESCLILRGFAAREQFVKDGRRQIAAIHIAGDFVDLHSLLLKVMDHSVVAIGCCEAAFVAHSDLKVAIEAAPHLGRLLWLSTVLDGAIERQWVTCLGRRSATRHLAHLMCEIFTRLSAVGLVTGNSFEWPLTQSELGDALGLSTVHVNRTIQELRAHGLLGWGHKMVDIPDFERLAAFADFDAGYLNLVNEPR